MSERDWSRHTTTGLSALGLIAALIIFAAYTFNLGSLSGFKEAETQRYTTEYADRTDERIAECDNLVGAARIRECVEKAVKANHENQRNERDLQSQRQMADWAFWLLVVSTVGTFITVGGTILIWKQVSLTREAVKDTGDATEAMVRQNQITENAQRPWVDIEIANVSMSSSKETFSLEVDLLVRNYGKLPALNILTRGRITIENGKDTVLGEFDPGENYTRITHNLLPGGSGHNSIHPRMEDKDIPKIVIFVGEECVTDSTFMPTLEVKADYEWGDPIERGRTVKRFMISAVDPVYHERDSRLGVPIELGAVPVTPLKAIEVASPEIT